MNLYENELYYYSVLCSLFWPDSWQFWYTHSALQCFRLDFNMTPHTWMPNWGVGVSSCILVNVVYLCPFCFYESTAVVENRACTVPQCFIVYFSRDRYIKYEVTFHFPVEFQIDKKWNSISCTLKDTSVMKINEMDITS